MITMTAMNVTLFSSVIVLFSIFVRLRWRGRPSVRTTSGRLLAVFGMFSLAGLYVWLSLGPELDARLMPARVAPGVDEPLPPIDV